MMFDFRWWECLMPDFIISDLGMADFKANGTFFSHLIPDTDTADCKPTADS